jgi:hypothetical protein
MPTAEASAKKSAKPWSRGDKALLAAIIGALGIGACAVVLLHQAPLVIPTPTPPSPNGYDVFVQASAQAPVQWLGSPNRPVADSPKRLTTPPSAAALAAVKQAPAANAAGLALVRRGLQYQCLAPQDRTMSPLHPELARIRGLARAIEATSYAQAAEDKKAEATQTALDGVEMGERITTGGNLLQGLVGIACCAIDRTAIWPMVDHLDAPTARAASLRLASIDAKAPPLSDILVNEKWTTEASLQKMYANPATSFLLQVTSLHSTRSIIDAYGSKMDERARLTKGPYSRTADAAPAGIAIIDKTMDMPLPQVWYKWCQTSVNNRLLAVTLALRAYELDHGSYPPALAALVPAYLPEIPNDPFTSGPLRYRAVANTYVLYSVGPDGIDDGGKPGVTPCIGQGPSTRSYAMDKDTTGDFVAGINR